MGGLSRLPRRPPRREIAPEAREAIDGAIRDLVKLAARRQALADHLAAMQPKADKP